MKHFKPCLLIVLLVIMASCGKEEVVLTGKLKVTYYNHPADFTITISPTENTSVDIVNNLLIGNNGTLTYELNAGNYLMRGSSVTSYFYTSKGFQIRAGETTEINL